MVGAKTHVLIDINVDSSEVTINNIIKSTIQDEKKVDLTKVEALMILRDFLVEFNLINE